MPLYLATPCLYNPRALRGANICLLLDEILEKDPENEALKEIKRQYDRIKDITNKFENITVYQTTDYIKGEKIIDIDKASKKM